MNSVDFGMSCSYIFALLCLVGVSVAITYIINETQYFEKLDNFGTSLCEEKGLVYDSFKHSETTGFKFYCKNETKIEDGYLVMVD